MKKILLSIIILMLNIILFGCMSRENAPILKDMPNQTSEDSGKEIRNLVVEFGKRLQKVSLLAPQDIVIDSMKENYGDLVAPGLLSKWQSDPKNAPGRLVSSPWPDRIEILGVEKLPDDSYKVNGEIIEITSREMESGKAAAKRPVTLTVKKIDNRYLIDSVVIGSYEENSIKYENTQYGFYFSLPVSWNGFTIIVDKWEGLVFDDSKGEKAVETGPIISIRHPEWTSKNPKQDIPIMVFTIAQWNSLQQEKFHIGAAPIGPKELGRNSKYVFALPARYNFAFPTGFEEVENILNNNPLKPTEDYK